MARSPNPNKRSIEPDAKYKSVKVAKLINRVMKQGKKSVAANQVYRALDILKTKTGRDPLEVLDESLLNITPTMEVRSRRVGGAAYQVPTPVRNNRGFSLALRWLVIESNKRPNKEFKSFAEKLVAEILDSLENTGGSVNRKLTAHKMADANKAFAHFRW